MSEPIPDDLRRALRNVRAVRAMRPAEADQPLEIAIWRERMADALEALAQVVLFEEDRAQALIEARTARAEAAQIRREFGAA